MGSCKVDIRDRVIPDGNEGAEKKIRIVAIRTNDEQIIRVLDSLWLELGKRWIRFLKLGRHDRGDVVQFNIGIEYRDGDYSPLTIISPFGDVIMAYSNYFRVFQNLKMDTRDVLVLSIIARGNPLLGESFKKIVKAVAKSPLVNQKNFGIVFEDDSWMGKLTVVIAADTDSAQTGAG